MRTSFEIFYLILALIVILYAALHYYIGLRGWQYLFKPLNFVPGKVYWTIFGLVAGSYIFARFSEHFLPQPFSIGLRWVGSYWMAIFFYLLLIMLVIELTRLSIKLFKLQEATILQTPNFSQYIAYGVVVLVVVIVAFGTWNAWSPKIVSYEVEINKEGGSLKELKVAMVSDIHLGTMVGPSHLTKFVTLVKEMKPDLILFIGDTLDDTIVPLENPEVVELLRQLEAPYGVYGVLGNHEYFSRKVPEVITLKKGAGITILKDSYIKVADSFYLVGRDDYAITQVEGLARKTYKEIVKGIDPSLPIIVMDHQPRDFPQAEEAGVDLLLSGHSHRGQLFPLNLITGAIYELDWGHLKRENLQAIVSSGFSTWGPPIRLGSRSELVEINIKFKNK